LFEETYRRVRERESEKMVGKKNRDYDAIPLIAEECGKRLHPPGKKT